MTQPRKFFLFVIEGRRYALGLDAVERVVRAVAVTPLSDGPDVVRGVINVQGRIVPVINLRRRLGFPDRETRLEDLLVISRSASRTVAFFADSVEGVVDEPEGAVTEGCDVAPGLEYVRGVMRLGEGLVVIHDLDRVLSLEDPECVSALLEGTTAHG